MRQNAGPRPLVTSPPFLPSGSSARRSSSRRLRLFAAVVSLGLVTADPASLWARDQTALAKWSDSELEKRVQTDLGSLGSLSIGLPNNGRLLNGVRPETGSLFEVVVPDFCWGTQETVDYLKTAVQAVHKAHPNTPPLHLGHISSTTGGYLSPHLSHQSGRDVDLGFYYKSKRAWYRRATQATLDVERTWTLVKAFITQTDVELLLIDHSIQALLRAHALKIGEDKDWIQRVFRGSPERPAIIRHARGHATHIHVRFFSPAAQANGQRAYPFLVDENLVEPVLVFTHHKVRAGETLGKLAKRYGTTVAAIQQANGLRGTTIQARRTYKIPKRGGPTPVLGELSFPSRELP